MEKAGAWPRWLRVSMPPKIVGGSGRWFACHTTRFLISPLGRVRPNRPAVMGCIDNAGPVFAGKEKLRKVRANRITPEEVEQGPSNSPIPSMNRTCRVS